MALIEKGKKILNPDALGGLGLKEGDIARTTGDTIYRRDYGLEKDAMPKYAKDYGAPKSDQDWRKFHERVYGANLDQSRGGTQKGGGGDPSDYKAPGGDPDIYGDQGGEGDGDGTGSDVTFPYGGYGDEKTSEYWENIDVSPVDEKKIQQNIYEQMQRQVDAINDVYAGMITEERRQGEGRMGQTRATGARSGLLGSDFGQAQQQEMGRYNKQLVENLQAEKQQKIAEVYDKFDQRAYDRIEAEREGIKGNIEDYTARQKEIANKAREDFKLFASSGVLQDPHNLNEDDYKEWAKQLGFGYDEETGKSLGLDMYFNANAPKEGKIDWQSPVNLGNGRALFYGFAPDGSLIQREYDAGLEAGEEIREMDGMIYKVKTDENGVKSFEPLYKEPGQEESFKLSEGEEYYQINPETGEWEVVASKAKTYKPGSGGRDDDDDELTKEEQEMIDFINEQKMKLVEDYHTGEDTSTLWGEAFDKIKARYPSLSNQQIDNMLNKQKYGPKSTSPEEGGEGEEEDKKGVIDKITGKFKEWF